MMSVGALIVSIVSANASVGGRRTITVRHASLPDIRVLNTSAPSSAFADIHVSAPARHLQLPFVTFAPRQPRMSGSLQADAYSRPLGARDISSRSVSVSAR